jgi:hypothetical protein
LTKKEDEKDSEDEIYKNLINSKLMSGGIEDRFLNCFSKDSRQVIKDLAELSNDKKLIQYVTKEEFIDEDESLIAIINEGKSEEIDKFIDVIQWNLTRKNPIARTGGPLGMTVSRCAFACILKINDLYTDFISLVDQMEMAETMAEGSSDTEIKKAVVEELKDNDEFKEIMKRWDSASKMRPWLQEKKQNISNKIKKQLEDQLKTKQEEEKKRKEALGEDKSKEESKDDEEEVIDTSKSKQEEVSPEETKEKEESQFNKLAQKVMQKAEFLIKMARPESWIQDDTGKSSINYINPPSVEKSKEGKEDKPDLMTRIKTITDIRTSKGSVKAYGNENKKDVYNSSSSSILACLQCDLSADRIKKGIEYIYINGLRRYTGLRIMGNVAQ